MGLNRNLSRLAERASSRARGPHGRAGLRNWLLGIAITFAVLLLALAGTIFGLAIAVGAGRGASTSDKAAALQALGGAGVLASSAVLTGVTAIYAWVTGEILRRGGPLIEVDLHAVWLNAFGTGSVSGPLTSTAARTPPASGFTNFMFGVHVRNKGAAATTVTSVGITMDGGFQYLDLQPVGGPRTPYRLEPQSEATFLVEPAFLPAAVKTFGIPPRVRGRIELASGEVHESRAVMMASAVTNPTTTPQQPHESPGNHGETRGRYGE